MARSWRLRRRAPPSAADSTDERPSFNQTFGYGKAEVLTPAGKQHTVFIPLNSLGFSRLLPYFRHEEDITRFGSQPLFIAVDKVQSISVTATGLYLEPIQLGRPGGAGGRLFRRPPASRFLDFN